MHFTKAMDFNYNSFAPNHFPSFLPAPFNMMPQPYQPNKEKEVLQKFWREKRLEIQNAGDFKSQPHLPLARIKRNMKANEDVKVVSAEAPVVIAKACELFIEELTLRAWMNTEENKRHTVRRHDIARAIDEDHTHTLDFLAHVVSVHHEPDCPLHHQGEMARNEQQLPQPYMMQMGRDEMARSEQQLPEPHMMQMGREHLAWNQQVPQPFMMQPPFMPSAYLPYNHFHPY